LQAIGIFGFDIFVVLARPGYRTQSKKRKKGRIGVQHRITKQDAMKWFQTEFGGQVVAATI
jgi:large subunit ribosomal protein L11e